MRRPTSRLPLALGFAILLFSAACKSDLVSNATPGTPIPSPTDAPEKVAEVSTSPFDPKHDIGIAFPGVECSELYIRNKDLKPGDEIQIVRADDLPQKIIPATIVGPNKCPRDPASAIEEIVLNEDRSPYSEYEIRFKDHDQADSGFAVVAAKTRVEIKKGLAYLTASNIRVPLQFRVCSGNESYHMTVWDGKPLIGKRVWYTYMSLGYDTVPTCKPAETKD